MSLAFNSNGDRFCVLNGGQVNGVNCYTVDPKLGPLAIDNSLRLLTSRLNQTTPPTGPANTASQIIFSEDDKQLIVSVKGTPPNDPGFFAVWDVASDGSLSADFKTVAPAKGGLLPFSMTVIPGQNAILATDAGLGFDILDLADASGSSANKIGGQVATCWSARSNATGNFYLTDIGASTVTEVHVDDNLKGSIVSVSSARVSVLPASGRFRTCVRIPYICAHKFSYCRTTSDARTPIALCAPAHSNVVARRRRCAASSRAPTELSGRLGRLPPHFPRARLVAPRLGA